MQDADGLLQNSAQNRGKACHNNNNTARQWVILAPKRPPGQQLLAYAAMPGWVLLVVELEATPDAWLDDFYAMWNASQPPALVFLDAASQQRLRFASHRQRRSSRARANLGFLYAIACGANIIFEAEEGVSFEGQETLQHSFGAGPFAQAQGDDSSFLVNPYALYGRPGIFPPGFPLTAVRNATFEFRKVLAPKAAGYGFSSRPLIESILVDGNRKTAAVLQLTQPAEKNPPQFYTKPGAIGIAPGYFAPCTLGFTFYHRDAFWALALAESPNQAVAPVVRSLLAQRLLWEVNGQLLISRATQLLWESQKHDEAEMLQAYQREAAAEALMHRLIQLLHEWKPHGSSLATHGSSLANNLLRLAGDIANIGLWSRQDVQHIADWVADLKSIGYNFPPLKGKGSLEGAWSGKKGRPRTQKLAAFCITGQIDRAPDSLPDTFAQLQKLLEASNDSQQARKLAQELEHSLDDSGSITFGHDTFVYASTYESCSDEVRWMAQQPFTYSILYNDPVLEVPYPLDEARFGGNAVVPMLYQMHALQQCFEMLQEHSQRTNTEYRLIVRLRTDHRIESMSDDSSAFALWSHQSLTHVTIPQPAWDFSDIMPEIGGYQDRIGWGPACYMQVNN